VPRLPGTHDAGRDDRQLEDTGQTSGRVSTARDALLPKLRTSAG